MKNRIDFRAIYPCALEYLDYLIEKESYIKKGSQTDLIWDQAAPKMKSHLANQLILCFAMESDPNIPWPSLIKEADRRLHQMSSAESGKLEPGLLYLHWLGRELIDRSVQAIRSYYSIDISLTAELNIDPQRILTTLVDSLRYERFSQSCEAELVKQMRSNPKLQAGFGISLDPDNYDSLVNESYDTYQDWAQQKGVGQEYEDDFHNWLLKHMEKPIHQRIQDASTLGVHISDKEKKRTNRNQRTISMHEENIKFPLWTNIPDPEFELTDDKKEQIKSLFDNVEGASGETGLKIFTCLWESEAGISNDEIAKLTHLSTKTVSRYIGRNNQNNFINQIKIELREIILQ